uniref:Uncharacterized protein n=1 Tax=viral metagenome TaxID=1070528 RepID=A0A6M3KC61_9ZZZZ
MPIKLSEIPEVQGPVKLSDIPELSPRYGSGLSPEFPDLPNFELSKELRERTENSLYYSQQYGIPPEMAFDMEPELKKQAEKLDLMSDIEKALYETPENIKIGTIGLAASTMFAIKRRAMMLSGGGIFPDEMVKHQFEPVKPMKREELPNIPGMIRPMTKDWPMGTLAEAFGLITRLPHIAGTIFQEEQRKLAETQDREIIKNAPITKAMRLVTQSGVPSMAAALGITLLTGDPTVALALLGEMEGGSAFQTQLEGGASIMKANVIGNLSEVAEIGGEMLVLPKIFKGVKEGFSLREALGVILENATQEGITGFNQRFLEVFGLETTKGMGIEEAAIKALNEGIKAIPENAWVGGASAGGPVAIRGGFDMAVSAIKGKKAVGVEVFAKPIAAEAPPTEAIAAPSKAVVGQTQAGVTITPEMGKPYSATLYRGTSTEGALDAGIYGKATYYTPDKNVAEHYRRGEGEILQQEVNLNNPFVGTESDFSKFVGFTQEQRNALAEKGVSQEEYDNLEAQNIRDKLEKMGHDGFVLVDKDSNVLEVGVFKQAPAVEKGAKPTEPERKVSRLAERTEELAVEKHLAENLGELPTYETMKMTEQAKMATEIIDRDYEQAKRIAMGKENPPTGLRAASMYEAVKYKAIKDNDVETLRRLATESTIPAELSALGQEIKAADTRTALADPVKSMQDIQKTREKVVKKRKKIKSIKRETSRMTEEIRSVIRETVTRRQNWTEFVESIRC